ncbi:MAG: 3'(2'),5'-bisphosphate nucleotidase CysQ [Gammaproteobacteria bacterium]|nr:3'(2'),5'-bisphosphate nucleotidase CysQ [Gammaproteobacteria bacterium]
MPTTEPRLEACIAIARAAGEAIMAIYAEDFSVQTKADQSPLTEADLASHRLIKTRLAQLTPEIPLLSEEGAAVAFEQRRVWRSYWLIDPLDGTKEFVRRNGEFTVNIALIEEGVPVLGVVHAPALAVTYAGVRGLGAIRLRESKRGSIHTRRAVDPPVLVISKSHRDAALDALSARLPAHISTSRGSSLKFCLVAEGSADFYPRTGPTSEWDTAAGQAVAEAAGAQVVRLPDWQPLRYNTKPSLINPGFAVIGDPAYPWRRHFEIPA